MSKKRGTPPASQQYEFEEEEESSSEVAGSEGASAAKPRNPAEGGEPAAGAAGGPDEGDDSVGDVPDLAAFFSLFPNCPSEEQMRLCRGYATYLSSLLPRTSFLGRAKAAIPWARPKGTTADVPAPDASPHSGSRKTAQPYYSPGPGGPVKRTKRYWEKK